MKDAGKNHPTKVHVSSLHYSLSSSLLASLELVYGSSSAALSRLFLFLFSAALLPLCLSTKMVTVEMRSSDSSWVLPFSDSVS
jgi:hypothetical protein